MPSLRSLLMIAGALLLASGVVSSCVQGQSASDLGDPGLPFGPTSVGTGPLAYVQDIKPVFDRDCLECHSARDARGNYSVGTYADVIAGQRRGDAASKLVVDCAPGGSMYQYFRSDAVANATMVFRWIVVDDGAQTR